jgi:NAD(P)H-dependent flavin oxidoreductase YrpB (nitropropane dioxygenase family)
VKNRIAELLGVEYSIIQGGTLQLGFSKLAAAVSNAGRCASSPA